MGGLCPRDWKRLTARTSAGPNLGGWSLSEWRDWGLVWGCSHSLLLSVESIGIYCISSLRPLRRGQYELPIPTSDAKGQLEPGGAKELPSG